MDFIFLSHLCLIVEGKLTAPTRVIQNMQMGNYGDCISNAENKGGKQKGIFRLEWRN